MRRLDRAGRIRFVDLMDGAIICPLDQRLMLDRFHVATKEGQILSGAAAFAAMWREIPALKPLGVLAQRPSILRLLERAYLRFLKIRPLLQRIAR